MRLYKTQYEWSIDRELQFWFHSFGGKNLMLSQNDEKMLKPSHIISRKFHFEQLLYCLLKNGYCRFFKITGEPFGNYE